LKYRTRFNISTECKFPKLLKKKKEIKTTRITEPGKTFEETTVQMGLVHTGPM
jgi:hypothetical protein